MRVRQPDAATSWNALSRRSAQRLSDRDGLSLLSHEAPFASLGLRLRRRRAERLGGEARRQRLVAQGALAVLLLGHAAHPPLRGSRARCRSGASGPTSTSRSSPSSTSSSCYGPSAPTRCSICSCRSGSRSALHPVGARWIQEHYAVWPNQGTFDYYGPLNTVALNIGYHNEHHDFPEIPWRRLPKLREIAPEYYEPLGCHRSWVKLFFTSSSTRAIRCTTAPRMWSARARAQADPRPQRPDATDHDRHDMRPRPTRSPPRRACSRATFSTSSRASII